MSTRIRKMLSDWDAPYIQLLVKQIETQSKETLTLWAVEYAAREILPIWTKHFPIDLRPQLALDAALDYLSGSLKFSEAKVLILECHAAAREATANPAAQAAARTIGQCAATIHTARHCIGLALYGALAVAYDKLGSDAAWKELEQCAATECGRMLEALQKVSIPDEPHPAKLNWHC